MGLPAGQRWQYWEPVTLNAEDHVPAGHAVGAEAYSPQKLPAGHAVHWVAPMSLTGAGA